MDFFKNMISQLIYIGLYSVIVKFSFSVGKPLILILLAALLFYL